MAPSKRRLAGLSLLAGTAVVAAVTLPLFQPWRVFTDKVVDEALPDAVSTGPSTGPKAAPLSIPTSSPAPPTISGGRRTSPTPAPASPSASGPVVLSRGSLITHEHDTSGTVSIVRLADGSRILRLEDLDTSDGPDLKVWLSDAPVLPGRAGWHVFDDGSYHNLGKLKGNRGRQNYVIPAELDLSGFRSVSIWCDRFNVSFGAAQLAAT
ncbi:hypothetical protein Kfla_2866 [Kribbella flavida DSM 17836]|uniref:DM13 domain-containing protein n=1 Tax=Kribbella flavida (strain DSM 17836 / JCM 10339 / NBRC 14399) TaxID=479435 RepID=D2Q0D9_KRIFD|nr:DM13 domain-containing protein [Kribbella flavida]ADB31931.1 hypothetical protein Kfla_2866 [Kribbella flavida DSM 17836]